MASKASDDQLPMEIIFEILSWLPVKSLLRFICVSKSWYSLISSREFIKTHVKTSSKTGDTARLKLIFSEFLMLVNPCISECKLNSALYDPMATEATKIKYPMYASVNQAENINVGKPAEILGFCNGLVCIAIWDKEMFLVLWNPSIRKYRRLPLDFDFKNSALAAYGFGYDELHDDYKFVTLLCPYDYNKCISRKDLKDQVVKIYSQRTNSWKRNEDSKNHISVRKWHVIRGGPFTGGKLHWTAIFHGYGDHHPANKIVSFDLADEIYGEIELPENMRERGNCRWSTGVLGEGCFALLLLLNERKLDVDVWIMTKYGVRESWTKMFAFRYPENCEANYGFDLRVQPVFLSKKGEILLKLGTKLVLHNPADDSYKDLQVNYNMPYVFGSLRVDLYIESLVLLDDHDGSIE